MQQHLVVERYSISNMIKKKKMFKHKYFTLISNLRNKIQPVNLN